MSMYPLPSAAKHVLSIPELVAEIVAYIYEGFQTAGYPHKKDLFGRTDYVATPGVRFHVKRAMFAPLARLNHLWFASVIPLLWRHPTQTRTDQCLTGQFWNIAPERRSLYAQYIERGTLVFTSSPLNLRSAKKKVRRTKYGETPESMLEGLAFPRMKTLVIKARLGDRLPRLGMNVVEDVLFDPHGRHVGRDQMHRDLRQIEVCTFKERATPIFHQL
ncbi:hypothetical protein PG993_000094 [Apiospora rasikravindrae]|uniref:Uncharacterized protein n=1 Tax=Apiospora rasikravindrae TaxID=990691 RepID=A0ABR1U7I9_9PEZI